MTASVPTYACRSALKDSPGDKAQHAGLLLSRYLKIAVKKDNHENERKQLFQNAITAVNGALSIYKLAYDRRLKMFHAGCEKNFHGRLVIGLGGESVLETGLTLHHTYGTPLIPGSALKGLASHYCDQIWGARDLKFKLKGRYHSFMFGGQWRENDENGDTKVHEEAGYITFEDAWVSPESLQPNSGLVIDVMTPHHGDYYDQQKEDSSPSDFDDPNLILFLSFAGKFHFHVSCDIEDEDRGKKWSALTFKLLFEALENWGIGGKTSSGYGRIEASTSGKSPSIRKAVSKPQHNVGDQVNAERITDPKNKDRLWFRADDGFGGVIVRGTPPNVELGEPIQLWIASVNNNTGYNFSAEPPSVKPNKPKPTNKSGRK